MEITGTIKFDTWDNVTTQNGEIELSDNNSTIKIPDWKIARKITDSYLNECGEEERDEIWKNLYDEPSYKDLEKEKFRLLNDIDHLKETIEHLENENDALRARR